MLTIHRSLLMFKQSWRPITYCFGCCLFLYLTKEDAAYLRISTVLALTVAQKWPFKCYQSEFHLRQIDIDYLIGSRLSSYRLSISFRHLFVLLKTVSISICNKISYRKQKKIYVSWICPNQLSIRIAGVYFNCDWMGTIGKSKDEMLYTDEI